MEEKTNLLVFEDLHMSCCIFNTIFEWHRIINHDKQQDRPLPKFGEWDVNDPASAEGFTVIFAKAQDDKKTNASGRVTSQRRDNNSQEPRTKKWSCCF